MVHGLQALLCRLQATDIDLEIRTQVEQLEVVLSGCWGLHGIGRFIRR
jgi:hypothetical protein